MPEINLVAKDGLDRGWRPKIAIFANVGLALPHVVEGCGRRHILSVQRCGDFAVTAPLTAKVEDTNYHGGGYRVDNQDVLILRAFQIADGSVAADIFSGLEGGLLDGPDLVAGVPSIPNRTVIA